MPYEGIILTKAGVVWLLECHWLQESQQMFNHLKWRDSCVLYRLLSSDKTLWAEGKLGEYENFVNR